jgi:hypothetical protein
MIAATIRAVDPLALRAIDDYHALLRDERALGQELQERFASRMREAGLTFGGRLLCPFLRPNLVSTRDYDQIRGVCRAIFRTLASVESRLGESLWDRVGLTQEERELVRIEPGFSGSSPTARLDSFLTPQAYRFVELNAESPAGIAYNEVLAELFLELPTMRAFGALYRLTPFHARERTLSTLLRCHRERVPGAGLPTIAIVDYEDVPTRTEHHLFRAFFEARGYPSLVCDPRLLTYDGGRLRHDGTAIDVVYRRLLVNELLEKKGELRALLRALADGAVTLVNPFRCKATHKKAVFAVLTDDELLAALPAAERAAITAHVPWTRRVAEARTTRQGQPIELVPFVRASRERLVMKPNDEYGGKGVHIGWESSEAEWDAAIQTALAGDYVVQEKVEIARLPFPSLGTDPTPRDLVVDLDPFVFDGEVEGFLTRLSGTSLANVTSGGGQVPSFLVEPLTA